MNGPDFDILWYCNDILSPSLAEFTKEPRSIRRALMASICLHQFIDYLEAERRTGLLYFHKEMRPNVYSCLQKYECFDRLAAVANAAKHKYRDRGRRPFFFVGWTFQRPPARAGIMQCGVSKCGDRTGGVEMEYDGNCYDIATLHAQCLSTLDSYVPDVIAVIRTQVLDKE